MLPSLLSLSLLALLLLSLALLYLFTLTPVGRLTLGLRENANRFREGLIRIGCRVLGDVDFDESQRSMASRS